MLYEKNSHEPTRISVGLILIPLLLISFGIAYYAFKLFFG